MKNPKVSVTIPVYNGQRTLRHCLSSVLNQTYKNYEVIVVDNNSTDKTKEIIKEFQEKSKKIKYFFEPKRGRGHARNRYVIEAKGSIIAMTDSDCIVSEDWIEKLTEPIISGEESVVMGFEQDIIKNYWTRNIQKANWNYIKQNLYGNYLNHVDTKNFAIRASLMKKMMFDSRLNNFEDFDLYMRLKRVAKIRFIPSIKVSHYHKTSFKKFIMNNFDRACWTKTIFDKHKKYHNMKKETMTQSVSIWNLILFPFWTAFQFLKKPFGEAFFILVSEVSWRVGLITSMIKK